MGVWKRIHTPETGFLNDLSDSVAVLEQRETDLLVDLAGKDIWIASDYSGQHAKASHEAYCFVLAAAESLDQWARRRLSFRERWLADGRRMAFKKLNESMRWRALPSFLDLADRLDGNLVCFVIDNRLCSLFGDGPRSAAELPEIFHADTRPVTVEKMLRVASFLSLLVSALRSEKRTAVWISDRDEALEDFDRRERLGRLIGSFIVGMTHWRDPGDLHFGTTALEAPGGTHLEDFAAIPDLVAGALGNAATALPAFVREGTWEATVRRGAVMDRRTAMVLDWLCRSETNLRRVILRVELDHTGNVRTCAQTLRHGRTST